MMAQAASKPDRGCPSDAQPASSKNVVIYLHFPTVKRMGASSVPENLPENLTLDAIMVELAYGHASSPIGLEDPYFLDLNFTECCLVVAWGGKGPLQTLDQQLRRTMPKQHRIDPADGCAYTWAEFQAFYAGSYSKKELKAYWKQCKESSSFKTQQPGGQLFKRPGLKVTFGKVLNVLEESFLLESQLASVLSMGESPEFQWWAGRSMLDFKSQEGRSFSFPSRWTALTPVVDVLVGVAKKTMPVHEAWQAEYIAGAGVLANGSFWWSHPNEDGYICCRQLNRAISLHRMRKSQQKNGMTQAYTGDWHGLKGRITCESAAAQELQDETATDTCDAHAKVPVESCP
eukprot:Skav233682  [mRNA]  locus=scaffold1927:126374:139178:- [translate_table: standard]